MTVRLLTGLVVAVPQPVDGGLGVQPPGPRHAHQLPRLHLLLAALHPPLVRTAFEVSLLALARELETKNIYINKKYFYLQTCRVDIYFAFDSFPNVPENAHSLSTPTVVWKYAYHSVS